MKIQRTKFVFFLVIATASFLPILAHDGMHGHEWSYEGADGPAHWGDLKPEYATCKVGKEQSPIDMVDPKPAALPAIRFDYKSVPLKIVNNGHTVQVNYAPGSFITVGDHRYQLVQFHFHRPSEERINGKAFEMVIHLVHADSDGKLAVIAVLLRKGRANSTLQEIWARMPKTEGKEQEIPGVQINALSLLPQDTTYYTYAGSLTTPPCSEGVTWFVLKTPVDISPEQIDIFAKLYPDNARPVQPIGARVVKAGQQ
jgi:carbonic anhydrase